MRHIFLNAVRNIGFDKWTFFNDLSVVSPRRRSSHGSTLNFYSAANNIGNFLPVMAIHQQLGENLDCWNMHDPHIDYDFINRNYKSIVIGGAGLLHPVFESFWSRFSKECKLPFIIWGVGGCYPDNIGDEKFAGLSSDGVFSNGMIGAFEKAELINVRDFITAERIGRTNVSITACPTLILLKNYRSTSVQGKKMSEVVYAPHSGLVTAKENSQLMEILNSKYPDIFFTENKQSLMFGLWDLIDAYCWADLVVTSRLHGAIIAWSLGTPFLALARDEKLDGFKEFAGVDRSVFRNVNELTARFEAGEVYDTDKFYADALSFAGHARTWCNAYS